MSDRCARCLPGAYVCPRARELYLRWESAATDTDRAIAWAAYVAHLDGNEQAERIEQRADDYGGDAA